MQLTPFFTYYANLTTSLEVGTGPFGNRLIVEVDGGEFEGPGFSGKIRPAAGADWLTLTEKFGHLDVRVTFETSDGALIFVEYTGKLELTDSVIRALQGDGGTEFGDQYFFTSPRMQTGNSDYDWVNNIVCLARGKIQPGKVDYEVFRVDN